jgi:hypothetical protein
MKKSQIKQLIREVLNKVILEKFTVDKQVNAFECGNLATDKEKGISKLSQVKELGGQISGVKNRPMEERTGRSSPQSSEEILSIRGVDGFDLDVTVEFQVYHGTNSPDDPTEVHIDTIIVENDYLEADLVDLNPEEAKVVNAVKLAVKSLNPSVQPGVLIPKGTDMMEVNKKLRSYLDTDIDKVRENVYEKFARYN